jgi:hypothetical protein
MLFHSSVDPSRLEGLVASKGAVGGIPKTGDDLIFNACFERLFRRAQGQRERRHDSFSVPDPLG